MKNLFFTLLVVMFSATCQGQFSYKFLSSQQHFCYGSGDFSVGSSSAGSVGMSYVYNSKTIVTVGFCTSDKAIVGDMGLEKSGSITNKNLPGEYSSGEENFHLMFGRVFEIAKNKNVRMVLQGGPALIEYRNPLISSSTSGHQMKYNKKVGFIFNPKLQVPLHSIIGISVGPMAILSEGNQFYGLGIGFMYGLVGTSR